VCGSCVITDEKEGKQKKEARQTPAWLLRSVEEEVVLM
jgi:hypothetical protein